MLKRIRFASESRESKPLRFRRSLPGARAARRATRRQYSAEEKIRIVLEGLRDPAFLRSSFSNVTMPIPQLSFATELL